jgi:hypothetical protein
MAHPSGAPRWSTLAYCHQELPSMTRAIRRSPIAPQPGPVWSRRHLQAVSIVT